MLDSTTQEQCYLLHFIDPETRTSMGYKHARHYLGTAFSLERRLAQHQAGCGARLTQVALAAGLAWVVARTWKGGREVERKLKGYHSGVKLCPICQGRVALLDVLPFPLRTKVSTPKVIRGNGRFPVDRPARPRRPMPRGVQSLYFP